VITRNDTWQPSKKAADIISAAFFVWNTRRVVCYRFSQVTPKIVTHSSDLVLPAKKQRNGEFYHLMPCEMVIRLVWVYVYFWHRGF